MMQEIILPMFLLENFQEPNPLDVGHSIKDNVDATAVLRKSDHLFIIPNGAQKRPKGF